MPKIKKIRKKKSKKLSNVVPLRKDLKLIEKDEPVLSVEEQEREKTNAFASKSSDEIDNFIKETKLTPDYAYYHFLFHYSPLFTSILSHFFRSLGLTFNSRLAHFSSLLFQL